MTDLVINSLERLPSHGRRYEEWICEAKKESIRRSYFRVAYLKKVKAIKERFPKAHSQGSAEEVARDARDFEKSCAECERDAEMGIARV